MRSIRLRASPDDPGTVIAAFPPDPELITLVKGVPGRRWNAVARHWLIPSTPETLENLRASCPPDVQLVATEDLRLAHAQRLASIAHAAAVREKGDSDIAWPLLLPPYAHQRASLEFLAHLGGGGLFHEMGLGKTASALAYFEYLAQENGESAEGCLGRPLRFLIICPNSVARVWSAEIEKHAGHNNYVVLTGLSIPERIKKMGTARYSIVNWEALSIALFAKALQAVEWTGVAADESTRAKNPRASRTKALHKLRTKHRLILTGTPITGKPEDAWAQLHFVAPGLLGSWWSFRDRYLALDYFRRPVGIKPGMADELKRLIASRSYRVLKEDVLDLPPKVYADRIVEMKGVQKQAYESMKRDLMVQIDGLPHLTASNILTMLLRLTQITAGMIGSGDKYTWLDKDNAKLAELDDLLNDELAGEQVVIFGQYQRELWELSHRYDGDTGGILYGPTPEAERARLIEQFQAGGRRLLFAQSRTGGIGITLTAAKSAVYFTKGWSYEEWLQSQDRLHRIGQTGTVSILSLIAKGSIDEEIAKALRGKQSLANALTGDDARKLARSMLK